LSEILAKRLKAARESKGWTQAYLADLLGLTNGTISGYERTGNWPTTRKSPELAAKNVGTPDGIFTTTFQNPGNSTTSNWLQNLL